MIQYKAKLFVSILTLGAILSHFQGCATFLASETVSKNERDFYSKPVLTDDIMAIGKPDENLLKQMQLGHAFAFIGRENTYMLYLGGEELEQISKLKLDSKRLSVGSEQSLYIKDKQVWGEIELYYSANKNLSETEQTQLELGGFIPDKRPGNKGLYSVSVKIEGVIYPAVNIPEEQISKLKVRRKVRLYNPREASPPVLGKILKAPIIATGVVVDVMLAPAYLAVGGVVLLGAAVSH